MCVSLKVLGFFFNNKLQESIIANLVKDKKRRTKFMWQHSFTLLNICQFILVKI